MTAALVTELLGTLPIVAIENVAAEVCPQCGERTYDPATAQWLLQLAATARASAIAGSRQQVVIFDAAAL
ncbi:MAG: YgiT-type zinc finger protein [Chloroflexi bacterium]|nr:YgiT-type zinc finger protein [Chloroflexota bacterium]